MKRSIEIGIVSGFILLWSYILYAKLGNFEVFKGEMGNQVFPEQIAKALPYLLPAIWILTILLLVIEHTRLLGTILNLSIWIAFSGYVLLALLHVYNRMPCSCSGILHFSWKEQFYFNLIVTAVAATGFILTLKERRRPAQ